jgi:hypothetical protein
MATRQLLSFSKRNCDRVSLRERLRVLSKEDWQVFGTRFEPGAIQRDLSRMLGREIIRPLKFDPAINFDHGAGRVVRRMLGRLYADAGQHEFEFRGSALGVWQLERSLINVVLEGLKHNYSKLVNGLERSVAPWQVRAMEEFILENPEQPLSLGDLAVVGGVSARSLQYTHFVGTEAVLQWNSCGGFDSNEYGTTSLMRPLARPLLLLRCAGGSFI